MKQWISMLVLLVLPLASHGAITVQDLYETEIPVADQSSVERQRALVIGLGEVLVRVSGTRDVVQLPQIQEVFKNPQQWMQQYRYRKQPVEGTQEQELSLWVQFNADQIARFLTENGMRIWSTQRPEVLLWLAVEGAQERFLVGGASDHPMREIIEQVARQRGVPLLMPLLDLEDQTKLQFGDVWGGFMGPISEASERYQGDAILVGRVFQQSDGYWYGRWTHKDQQGQVDWVFSDYDWQQVLANSINVVADRLAAAYGVLISDNSAQGITLAINGIQSLQDYVRTQQFLASLSIIDRMDLVRVEPKRLTFDLEIKGEVTALVRALNLGDILQPYEMPVDLGLATETGPDKLVGPSIHRLFYQYTP